MLKKAAVLVGLLVLAFGVMMLTTQKATFSVSHSRPLSHSAEKVWNILSAVEKWATWWPGIVEASLEGKWEVGGGLHLALKGSPEKPQAVLVRLEPMREVAWERRGVLGSTTCTSLQLQQLQGERMMTMTLTIHGPQAFLARFTGRDEFDRYQRLVLERMRQHLEEGA